MAYRYVMTAPGAEHVEREEVDVAPPAPGEVQVRMRASSLNYHDLVTLLGFIPDIDYPLVPMSDGCGEVVAVGEGVRDLAVGDPVLSTFYPRWQSGRPSPARKALTLGENTDGCLQEFLNLPVDSVVRAPKNLSAVEASTLVCAGHTAWYALMEEWCLHGDATVLVQGTGGVSLFALQFAKALGATVVATTSSAEKAEKLRALGADHVINYIEYPDWEQQVMTLTGGVDAVVDVGGEATLGKSVACTKVDGFIAVIGVLSGFGEGAVSIIDVMQKNLTIKGITVGCADSLDRLCRFVEGNDLHPLISHTLEAGELAKGVELMSSGKHFGKIAFTLE